MAITTRARIPTLSPVFMMFSPFVENVFPAIAG